MMDEGFNYSKTYHLAAPGLFSTKVSLFCNLGFCFLDGVENLRTISIRVFSRIKQPDIILDFEPQIFDSHSSHLRIELSFYQ